MAGPKILGTNAALFAACFSAPHREYQKRGLDKARNAGVFVVYAGLTTAGGGATGDANTIFCRINGNLDNKTATLATLAAVIRTFCAYYPL